MSWAPQRHGRFFFLLSLSFFVLVLSSPVSAFAAVEPACVGSGLADYVADVLSAFGGASFYGNVRFLTPVFNATNPGFPSLVSSFSSGLGSRGYSFGNFAGVAMNAYNMDSGSISHWVSVAKGTAVGSHPLFLTEIGWYPHQPKTTGKMEALRGEIDKFGGLNVTAGLIFNIFGCNSQFSGQDMTDDEVGAYICPGGCSRVGANSAMYFSQCPILYDRAVSNGMGYILEIANAGDVSGSVITGVGESRSRGLIPIVRLGAGGDSGGFDEPATLVSFIQTLDQEMNVRGISGPVYVVLGSNEPLTETWATPGCGGSAGGQGVTLSGQGAVRAGRKVTDTSKTTTTSQNPAPVAGVTSTGDVLGWNWTDWLPSGNSILGSIWLSNFKFPDFSATQKRNTTGLKWLLSPDQSSSLDLPGSTTISFALRVLNMLDADPGIPTTMTSCGEENSGGVEVSVPSRLWGRLVGSSELLKFLLNAPGSVGTITAPKVDLEDAGETCGTFSHGPGPLVPESLAEVRSDEADTSFDFGGSNHEVRSRSGTSTAQKIIDLILYLITKTRTELERVVQPLAYGEIAGVSDLVSSAILSSHNLMDSDTAGLLSQGSFGEAGSLNSTTGLSASLTQSHSGEAALVWSNLAPIRGNKCIELCETLAPGEKPDDPMCRPDGCSDPCDPECYTVPPVPRTPCKNPDGSPDLSRDPQDCAPPYCTWKGSYCQYGAPCEEDNDAAPGMPGDDYPVAGCPPDADSSIPEVDVGCYDGADPVCESCLGLPHSLVVGKGQADPGGTKPDSDLTWCDIWPTGHQGDGGEKDCMRDCNLCKWVDPVDPAEDTYTDSNFDGCYYSQGTCVRTDIPQEVIDRSNQVGALDSTHKEICSWGCAPRCCSYCGN